MADAAGGVDGDALYARLAVEQWLVYKFPDDKAFAEADFDYDRVVRGLRHLAQNGSDRLLAGHIGLRLAFGRRDRAAANAFAQGFKHVDGGWQPGWWQHDTFYTRATNFALTGQKAIATVLSQMS